MKRNLSQKSLSVKMAYAKTTQSYILGPLYVTEGSASEETYSLSKWKKQLDFKLYINGCRGIWQLGGLVPVVRLGVLLRWKACKLGDLLSFKVKCKQLLL